MVSVECVVCGDGFEAKLRTAKYCGERCKKRARRSGQQGAGSVVALPSRPSAVAPVGDDGPAAESLPPLVQSVVDTLAAAGRLDTWRGQQALHIAVQIHAPMDTGSAKAALHRQLDVAMGEALRGAGAGDLVNELEERIARKLAGGA